MVQEHNGRSIEVVCDVTEQGAAEAIVERAVTTYGGVGVLVHAAGGFEGGATQAISPDQVDRQFRLNVFAPFYIARAALKHLQPAASIVFISSVAAVKGGRNVIYCATKGAIESMARALAIELSPRGVRVNVVRPGFIETPLTEDSMQRPDKLHAIQSQTPLGRLGDVDEIASVIALLATRAGGFMQGSVITVDGGLSIR